MKRNIKTTEKCGVASIGRANGVCRVMRAVVGKFINTKDYDKLF